jgi:hypothetical protein
MNTTLDKIKVFTPNFSMSQMDTFGINSHNKQPNQPLSETPCAFLNNGTPIIGQNAYLHSEGEIPFHLNIQMLDGIPLVWLEFNPNKYKGKLHEAIALIDSSLKGEHRFELDFDNARLSRLDMARDNQMERIAKDYHEAKKHLTKARYYTDKTQYPDSLLFKKGGWQMSDYDRGKKNELDKGHKNPISTNFLRSELRLMTPKYVKNHLGFSDLGTLQELNETELHSFYVNTQRKFIKELDNSKQYAKSFESVGDILARMPDLMAIRSHREKIHRYFIGLNSEFQIVTARHNFIEAFLHYIETQKTFPSKSAKCNFKSTILKTLDSEIRKANADKQKNKAQMDKSLPTLIEEYTYKFLTA